MNINIKMIIIDLKNNKFPKNLVNELDESQLHAIKHCLLNKIALIQGPPGTGKTHITSILTNIFRENLKNDSKILIVCFTNHALDQFLENIIKENETDVLRVGGRCKNEKIINHKGLLLNSNEKYKSEEYRSYERKLNQYSKEMANLIQLINDNLKIDIEKVKKDFPIIYEKVVNDFFK